MDGWNQNDDYILPRHRRRRIPKQQQNTKTDRHSEQNSLARVGMGDWGESIYTTEPNRAAPLHLPSTLCPLPSIHKWNEASGQEKKEVLELRSTHPNRLLNIILIRAEGLLEHSSKLHNLALERALVLPRESGVEDFPGDTFDALRNREVEHVKVFVLGRRVGQFARMDRVDDTACVLERAASPRTVLASRPARVDQPAVGVGRGHAFRKHGGVARGLHGRVNIR